MRFILVFITVKVPMIEWKLLLWSLLRFHFYSYEIYYICGTFIGLNCDYHEMIDCLKGKHRNNVGYFGLAFKILMLNLR